MQWHDNLEKKELPPEWMWHLDEELIEHFQRINEEREERYGTPSSRDDSDSGTGQMVQNEYARGLRP